MALCPFSLLNTGSACTPIQEEAEMIIFMPTFDNDGNRNKIDLTDTFSQAFFDAQINASDDSQRWFPTPLLKNPSDLRGDPIVQAFNDGSKIFIQQSARELMAFIPKNDATPQLLGKLEGIRNVDTSFFIVDKSRAIWGNGVEEEGFLYPIRMSSQSFNGNLIKATGGNEAQMIKIAFDILSTERDQDLRAIKFSEMSANPLNLTGLIDVFSVFSLITITSFKVVLSTEYGTPIGPVLDTGLLAGNFSLFNVTDNLAVAITSMTESPDGTYTIGYAAQTSADVMRLTPSKNGRDYTAVVADTFVIP